MNETLSLLLPGVIGLFLGAIFFGGLWWTVRKGLGSRQSALWFFGSLLLRMAIVLVGFYFVGRGDWKRLLVCLLGFVVARFMVTRLTRLPVEDSNPRIPETSHAP